MSAVNGMHVILNPSNSRAVSRGATHTDALSHLHLPHSKSGDESGGSRNVKSGDESGASRNSKSRDRCEQFKPLEHAREGGRGGGGR